MFLSGSSLMRVGGERELALGLASCMGVGRMWSGGTREHYASEISDRKLLHTSPVINNQY